MITLGGGRHLLCDGSFVVGAHHYTRLMQVLEKGDLLREYNMHHVALLVEAHALDRQEVGRVEVVEGRSFAKDVIDDLVLHHFEVDHPGDQRDGRLVLLVKRLDFEKGAEWVLLFALVELFVETELLLACEDAVGVIELLRAVSSFIHGVQALEPSFYFVRVGEIGDATCLADHI